MHFNTTFCTFLMALAVNAVVSTISTKPKNAVKKLGDTVEFKCITERQNCSFIDWQKIENRQSPLYVYRFGNGMLNPDKYEPARYTVTNTSGCNLIITNLKHSDSGQFICFEAIAEVGSTSFGAILVVIDAKVSECKSNVTQVTELSEGDAYGLTCSATIPAKSVEPSNVTLSWIDVNQHPIQTAFNSQQDVSDLTVSYSEKAKPKEESRYTCRASFVPLKEKSYDQTVAYLDICDIQIKDVSYSVRDIQFSPNRTKFPVGSEVLCSASGFPPPNFTWKNLKTKVTWANSSLVIEKGSNIGDEYTCTAQNEVKGALHSASLVAVVAEEDKPSTDAIVGAVVGICAALIVCSLLVLVCYRKSACPLYKRCHQDLSSSNGKDNSSQPLKHGSNPPPKPPRTSQDMS